ncbi:hypothetical protein EJ06DRAFT_450500, partial [Trichodelitschia bisporula]
PSALRFVLAVILSFGTSYALYTFGAPYTAGELSAVSRRVVELEEVLAFPAWRIVELGVGWLAGYDDYDVAALIILTRLPYYFLLNTFYEVSLTTSALALTFDVVSAALPFTFLRKRHLEHVSSAPKSAVPNQGVINNKTIFGLTSLLSSSLYTIVLYASFRTWLPVFVATHFHDLPTLELAHSRGYVDLLPLFVPLGWAAFAFLFSPSAGAQNNLGDARAAAFNPATASMWDHIVHNAWGWEKGTRVLISRTVVIGILVGVGTWVRVWGTVEGAESLGALGWAALWAGAGALNAAAVG